MRTAAREYLAEVRERTLAVDRRARGRPGGARDGHPPRAPAHRDDAPGHAPGRAAGSGRPGACDLQRRRAGPSGSTSPPGPPCSAPRDGVLRLRQRAPAPPRRARRLPHRAPPGHQRDVAALHRGRRLRAPRVVERRGLGVEGGLRHRQLSGRRGGTPGRSGVPRLLVRGRRLRPLARSTAPHRSGVGEGGDLDPRRPPGHRTGLGVDHVVVRRLPRLRRPSVPRVLGGLLRRAATACCAAARGRPTRASPPSPSATGTSPSAGRSSPASASPPITRRADDPAADHRRDRRGVLRRPQGRALAGRRRARRPHTPVQGAAAQALLRRARRRAVRPHLRAARVLPDAHRARDPRASAARRSSRPPAPRSSSSSARARRPRRGCCCARWPRPARCAATSRST